MASDREVRALLEQVARLEEALERVRAERDELRARVEALQSPRKPRKKSPDAEITRIVRVPESADEEGRVSMVDADRVRAYLDGEVSDHEMLEILRGSHVGIREETDPERRDDKTQIRPPPKPPK